MSPPLAVSPLVAVALTLTAYQAALALQRRAGGHPLANPVLVSVLLIAGVLAVTETSYETYFAGAQVVHLVLGPATVALALPLYAQLDRLKSALAPLAIALPVGSLTAIASAVIIGRACGASTELLFSLAPKSSTMPIAMGVTERLGGIASLTALTVTITGVSGAIMARGLLALLRIDDEEIRGFAVGLTAHAIGTATIVRSSETAGAFAALAMGLNGVATSVLVPILLPRLP